LHSQIVSLKSGSFWSIRITSQKRIEGKEKTAMKISGNDEIIQSSYPNKPQRSEQTSSADFKNILKASVEKSVRHGTQITPPPSINPISAVRFNPESLRDKASAIKRVDDLINLLDDYRKQLADPAITLRSIEPVMKKITKEKDQLSMLLDSLPNEDGLKDIVNRALITASLEVIKFNRGDYITS